MWGQVSPTLTLEVSFRIIPTRVGTSLWCNPCTSRLQDHPHACGDKLHCDRIQHTFRGSSPRVWGQVDEYFSIVFNTGIIPTRVGTRIPARASSLFRIGSSPRVWGQAITVSVATPVTGIIPTRVGTRNCWTFTAETVKDHPHACVDKHHK